MRGEQQILSMNSVRFFDTIFHKIFTEKLLLTYGAGWVDSEVDFKLVGEPGSGAGDEWHEI